jgi:hypothetical protein
MIRLTDIETVPTGIRCNVVLSTSMGPLRIRNVVMWADGSIRSPSVPLGGKRYYATVLIPPDMRAAIRNKLLRRLKDVSC